VAVPRVGRGTRATEEVQDDRGKTYFHYQLRWGGRRSKAEIIAEMERDWAVPPTMPRPASKAGIALTTDKNILIRNFYIDIFLCLFDQRIVYSRASASSLRGLTLSRVFPDRGAYG
jgi:hypothetical protein